MTTTKNTTMKRITILVWVLVAGVFLVNIALGVLLNNSTSQKKTTPKPSPSIVRLPTVAYQGEEGKDALSLLKEKAKVIQNASGLVTTINGYEASEKKREFWSFYINGKQAQVGPAEYQTQKGDSLEWRVEKY